MEQYEILNLENHGHEFVEEGWQFQDGAGVWHPFHRQYYDNYRADYWYSLLRAGRLRRPIKKESERLLKRCDIPRVVLENGEEVLATKRQTGGIYNMILIDRKPLSKLDKVKGIGASAKAELTLMADDMWEV